MFIQLATMCQNPALATLLSTVKRIMTLIQIIAPIVLIVSASVSFILMMANPEEKKATKHIFNKFIAAVIIFFIPVIINVLMSMLGDDTHFSSCWESADEKATPVASSYDDEDSNKTKKSPISDPSSYEH